MTNIFNTLMEDTSQYDSLLQTAPTVFKQQILKNISEVAKRRVHRTNKTDPEVIKLASKISNMEILLSEDGQSFPLSDIRTQPNYGPNEVTWVVNKLKKQIPDKLLRPAIAHLIIGSEVTKSRDVFLDVMGASVFVVDHVYSLTSLIGYAIAFKCKSVYELSDLFNFHIVKQDYSQDVVRWFYNNTHSLQGTVI